MDFSFSEKVLDSLIRNKEALFPPDKPLDQDMYTHIINCTNSISNILKGIVYTYFLPNKEVMKFLINRLLEFVYDNPTINYKKEFCDFFENLPYGEYEEKCITDAMIHMNYLISPIFFTNSFKENVFTITYPFKFYRDVTIKYFKNFCENPKNNKIYMHVLINYSIYNTLTNDDELFNYLIERINANKNIHRNYLADKNSYPNLHKIHPCNLRLIIDSTLEDNLKRVLIKIFLESYSRNFTIEDRQHVSDVFCLYDKFGSGNKKIAQFKFKVLLLANKDEQVFFKIFHLINDADWVKCKLYEKDIVNLAVANFELLRSKIPQILDIDPCELLFNKNKLLFKHLERNNLFRETESTKNIWYGLLYAMSFSDAETVNEIFDKTKLEFLNLDESEKDRYTKGLNFLIRIRDTNWGGGIDFGLYGNISLLLNNCESKNTKTIDNYIKNARI